MAKQLPIGLVNGEYAQLNPAVTTAGAADSGKLVALDGSGRIDEGMMPLSYGLDVERVPASEALAAGAFINLWSDAGTVKARLADNSNGRRADGFVKLAVALGATATIYDGVPNESVSGRTPGARQYLGTAGGAIEVPLDNLLPANSGKLHQVVGKATSANAVDTQILDHVVI